jgi:sec-independent protein translocase protein TatA
MFRNGLEPWHVIILVLAFILLFGYKKLPDAARSIGRSMRIFKAETKGLRGDDDATETAATPPVAETATPPAAPAATPPADQTRVADQERV